MQTIEITGEKLKELLLMDPDWVGKTATPDCKVIVTTYANLSQSPITTLSPHIHFQGSEEIRYKSGKTEKDANVADLSYCKTLKVAEGTFHGHVNFSDSSIEKIGELNITQPNNYGDAANFTDCENLKAAEGTFPGFVDFSDSNVEKINGLVISAPNTANRFFSVRRAPIEENPEEIKKLTSCIKAKSVEEFKQIKEAMCTQIPVCEEIEKRIQRLQIAQKQNNAVEIDID